MRPLELRWVLLALSVVVLVAGPAWSQDAQADRAKALLKQGIKQYSVRSYKQAQTTLVKVDRSKLSSAERTQLDDHLSKVNDAIKKQAAAMEAYADGEKALKANELQKARTLFEQAVQSQFVPAQVRRDARARVAEVTNKIAAAKAAEPKPKPAAAPKPAPKVQPKPAPKVQPKPKPDETAAPLAALQARIKRADAAIAKGNEALAKDGVDQAIVHFQEAAKIAPQYDVARQRLEFARSLVGRAGGPSAISQLERKRQIQKQDNEVRYAEVMKRSHEALQGPRGPEDFDRAAQEVNHAKTLVETRKSLYTDSEYRRKRIEIDERLRFIDLMKTRWEKQRVATQLQEIKRTEKLRLVEMERRKQAKLRKLRARTRALRHEQRYTQAIEVLEEILRIDPKDQWAAEWRDYLRREQLLMEDKAAFRTGLTERLKQFNAIRVAEIPWHELVRFPEDWPAKQVSPYRGVVTETAESEENRLIRKKMRLRIRELDVSGLKFKDVIGFLRDMGDVNIVVNWGALQAAGVDTDTVVGEIKLTNVTFEKALTTVLDTVGGGLVDLRYVVDQGVITISTKEELEARSEKQPPRVYDIRDLIIRVPNFEGPEIETDSGGGNTGGGSGGSGGLFSSSGSGGGSGGSSGTSSGGGAEENEMSREDMVNSILDLIRATIDRDSWEANSGTVGSIRELGGQIIVRQTAENHRLLVDLLRRLREARTLQINVEARFISVNTGFLNNIGIDMDFYFNLDSRLINTGLVDMATGAYALVRQPTYMFEWGGRGRISNQFTALGVRQWGVGTSFTSPQTTGVSDTIAGTAVGNALTVAGSFLDQIQVDFLITATQAHQSTRTLTGPRLTLYNGQRAFVSVGTDQYYVANVEFVPGTGEGAIGGYDRTIEVVTTGTVLDVEATVSADRRYVTMTVRPTVSIINGFTEYLGAMDFAGTPIPGSGLIQLPNITRQMIRCTVTAPDGGTLLLGGQRLAGEIEREMGVPILSKIPVLKRAFTNTVTIRDEQTLLILVKPEIMILKEYEDQAYPP